MTISPLSTQCVGLTSGTNPALPDQTAQTQSASQQLTLQLELGANESPLKQVQRLFNEKCFTGARDFGRGYLRNVKNLTEEDQKSLALLICNAEEAIEKDVGLTTKTCPAVPHYFEGRGYALPEATTSSPSPRVISQPNTQQAEYTLKPIEQSIELKVVDGEVLEEIERKFKAWDLKGVIDQCNLLKEENKSLNFQMWDHISALKKAARFFDKFMKQLENDLQEKKYDLSLQHADQVLTKVNQKKRHFEDIFKQKVQAIKTQAQELKDQSKANQTIVTQEQTLQRVIQEQPRPKSQNLSVSNQSEKTQPIVTKIRVEKRKSQAQPGNENQNKAYRTQPQAEPIPRAAQSMQPYAQPYSPQQNQSSLHQSQAPGTVWLQPITAQGTQLTQVYNGQQNVMIQPQINQHQHVWIQPPMSTHNIQSYAQPNHTPQLQNSRMQPDSYPTIWLQPMPTQNSQPQGYVPDLSLRLPPIKTSISDPYGQSSSVLRIWDSTSSQSNEN